MYNDRRWQRASRQFLKAHPLCVDPFETHGERSTLSECTDHVVPHRGNYDLFWNPANWQALCRACNSRKG